MMSCLSLPKKWGWPVCLVWGPGSCIRGSGLRACAFQGEQQSGTLLHPRDRPGQKVQKGKLSPESPSQTGAFPPHAVKIPHKWENFPLTSQEQIRPCPDILVFLSQHLERAHVPIPGTKSMGGPWSHWPLPREPN